ncbi:MAG: hypothetical protein IPI46_14070 [Bacteroidetes bacterium]|nr:hypothetical protein [Bacteroidota bacterium]
MKIKSIQETEELAYYRKGRETALRTWLSKLAIGESLEISKTDWPGKRAPYYIANYYTKNSNRRFSQGRLPDNKGWVFIRMS